jgi:two-component system, OmpR family, alkaline phosphatase synthesis response regulator PhoP
VFDLILLDITMPKVDGYDVLKFAKEHCKNIKVVMLTGSADLIKAVEAMKLRAENFLGEPFDLAELFSEIQPVLQDRKL